MKTCYHSKTIIWLSSQPANENQSPLGKQEDKVNKS